MANTEDDCAETKVGLEYDANGPLLFAAISMQELMRQASIYDLPRGSKEESPIQNNQTVHGSQRRGERSQIEDCAGVSYTAPRGVKWSGNFFSFLNQMASPVKAMGKSGTTALLLALQPDNSIHAAHIGDCEGIIVFYNRDSKAIELHRLTKPHHVNDPDEREKLIRNGASIYQAENDPTEFRIEDNTKKRGLNLSRTIGDVNFHGMLHTPDLSFFSMTKHLSANPHLVPVALVSLTDGVMLDPPKRNSLDKLQTAIDFWYQNHRTEVALGQFLTATASWMKKGDESDNMTIVVVDLAIPRSQDVVINMCDGHGGAEAAQFVSRNFQQAVIGWCNSDLAIAMAGKENVKQG